MEVNTKDVNITEQEIQEAINQYQEYAKSNGFKLNPNPKIVEALVKALLRNEKLYGARYCPCRRRTGNVEEDKKIICPCAFHKQEIQTIGHCHCGLFFKP